MKTRNGFVSNSSSSSFVIIGYKADEIFSDRMAALQVYAPEMLKNKDSEDFDIEEAWYELVNRKNPFGVKGIKYLSDDGPGYLGIVLADSDENNFPRLSIDLKECTEKMNEIKYLLGTDKEPRLIIGTRAT